MSRIVLAVDIGNTSTTTALVTDGVVSELQRFPRINGVEKNVVQAAGVYGGLGVQQVVVGSVVPDLTRKWKAHLSQALVCEGWELVPGSPLEIPVNYPNPTTIGADRLANAVAAVRKVGAPVVVADFGTALTFDIVTEAEGYIGGVIAPGIDMMYSYFGEKTALLPKLTPQPCAKVVGRSTEEAMHAGAYYGYRGMVREIFTQIRKDLALPEIKLLATGGFASTVLRDFDESVMLCPHLTLEGLVFAWQYADSTFS
ncbi:type III pantothenate kinase [Kiritimatiellaeota bacterium B1221]|nr:type III pantothenate kinase [Kiritimatiellaeota bacterium B1221]